VVQEDLGMTPKHYGRIARLRRALARDGSRESWARVALEAGFHDPSHGIREFCDLLQDTPEAFRQNARVRPVSTGPRSPARG
jgi:transcriptional regulator GlxA family with amidase domain